MSDREVRSAGEYVEEDITPSDDSGSAHIDTESSPPSDTQPLETPAEDEGSLGGGDTLSGDG